MKINEPGRTCSTNGVSKKEYNILVAKSGGKRPRWRPRIKQDDNIKIQVRVK
jgi:hypothetical protein